LSRVSGGRRNQSFRTRTQKYKNYFLINHARVSSGNTLINMIDFASSELLLPHGENATHKMGEKQPSQCRDPFFAILFYLHVALMIFTAIILGGPALAAAAANEDASHGRHDVSQPGLLYLVLIIGLFCSIFSYFGLVMLMKFSDSLIQIALVTQLATSFFMILVSLTLGRVGLALMGLISFAVVICYTCMVWSKIPFASALLDVAIRAVKANMGMFLSCLLRITLERCRS
jgi:hypothetical protein